MAGARVCLCGLSKFRSISALAKRGRFLSTKITTGSIGEISEGVYPDVEVSQADWKWVERIIPNPVVPEPPKHDSYPTPSGWVPPTAGVNDNPYFVKRTRYHNFPIYTELRDGATRKLTQIRLVEGNIWAFEADLKQYLEEQLGQRVFTQVDEVCRKVRVRGIHVDHVSDFLVKKGF